MPHAFHVQYGLTRQVGRFVAREGFARGQSVVVRSGRGTELGTVVAEAPMTGDEFEAEKPEILRVAGPDDLARAGRAVADRHRRFDECRKVFDRGTWPIEPIDVEPLLDDGRAVLYYLGPHRLDVAGLRAAIWDHCGLDLVFEPAGLDATEPEPESEPEDDQGCGSCGTGGGCGSGGCGSKSADQAGGGCSGCAVSDLVAARRSTPTMA